jgi:hypothetical protein
MRADFLDAREIAIDHVAEPAGFGTQTMSSLGEAPLIQLSVQFPSPWPGGRLRIEFCIARKSADARERWIAIKRTIKADRAAKKVAARSAHI